MNLSHPFELISHPLDGRVLEILAGADAAMTPGHIARLARDVSERGIRMATDRLRRQGILAAQPAGKATLYRLNREHLAAPYVIGLAHVWHDFVERLRGEFRGWDPAPVAAYLFGSVARGQGEGPSDIDIFVVRPDAIDGDDAAWLDRRDHFAAQVTSWTGNDTRILEYPEREALVADGEEPVLAAIRDEGIPLTGDSDFLSRGSRR